MGTGTDAFSGFASDGWIGQPNIGLSQERIQELCRQADERIAAENKAKEEKKARKAAAKGKQKMDNSYSGGDPIVREEDKKGGGGAFGWLKKGLRGKH